MFSFTKHRKYRRQEIWEIVKGSAEKMSLNFQQSGYERINEDLFAFINIGYQGHAGQTFPNKYDESTETVMWYGKKERNSFQPATNEKHHKWVYYSPLLWQVERQTRVYISWYW